MKPRNELSPWIRRERELARAQAARLARYRETRRKMLTHMNENDPLYGFTKWWAEHGRPS